MDAIQVKLLAFLPRNLRTAGSLKKSWVRFSSSQIRTWDSWVRSANATALPFRHLRLLSVKTSCGYIIWEGYFTMTQVSASYFNFSSK